MKELLKDAKDFKIIPNNFKSSGAFELIDVNDETITAKLILSDKKELNDYEINSNVEVFGVNKLGLVYFETKILNRVENEITLAITQDFSLIQRREYSRVGFNQGKIIFKDMSSEFCPVVLDISAGGVKLDSTEPLELDKHYSIEIALSSNMKIECMLQPIRIKEINKDNKKSYIISGKFVDLENVDRIVLVQYAFKIKMEEQNRENK